MVPTGCFASTVIIMLSYAWSSDLHSRNILSSVYPGDIPWEKSPQLLTQCAKCAQPLALIFFLKNLSLVKISGVIQYFSLSLSDELSFDYDFEFEGTPHSFHNPTHCIHHNLTSDRLC